MSQIAADIAEIETLRTARNWCCRQLSGILMQASISEYDVTSTGRPEDSLKHRHGAALLMSIYSFIQIRPQTRARG
jgi:hypothetical protein